MFIPSRKCITSQQKSTKTKDSQWEFCFSCLSCFSEINLYRSLRNVQCSLFLLHILVQKLHFLQDVRDSLENIRLTKRLKAKEIIFKYNDLLWTKSSSALARAITVLFFTTQGRLLTDIIAKAYGLQTLYINIIWNIKQV